MEFGSLFALSRSSNRSMYKLQLEQTWGFTTCSLKKVNNYKEIYIIINILWLVCLMVDAFWY
jgi:hypothetical protein